MKFHTVLPLSSVFLACAAGLPLCGCSGPDNDVAGIPGKPLVLTDTDGLRLTYNGQPVTGKTVEVTSDGDNLTVAMSASFDLSSLGLEGLTGSVPAAGVFPGSLTTVINAKTSSRTYPVSFSGSASSDYTDFSYSGLLTAGGLELALTDVVLKSGGVTPSVWKPADTVTASDGSAYAGPIVAEWVYEPLPDIDLDLSGLLRGLASLPLIKTPSGQPASLNEALLATLKTVALLGDGNVVVTYVTDAFGTPQFAQTLPNRFRYVVAQPGMMKFYCDPMSLFGLALVNMSGSIPADWVHISGGAMMPTPKADSKPLELPGWMAGMVPGALKSLCLNLAEGIPADFVPSGGGIELYLNSEMAAGLAGRLINLVSTDPDLKSAVAALLAADPRLAPLAERLDEVLPLVPSLIERTQTLKLGIALEPAQ